MSFVNVYAYNHNYFIQAERFHHLYHLIKEDNQLKVYEIEKNRNRELNGEELHNFFVKFKLTDHVEDNFQNIDFERWAKSFNMLNMGTYLIVVNGEKQ